jgi:hypothetical protein
MGGALAVFFSVPRPLAPWIFRARRKPAYALFRGARYVSTPEFANQQ